MEEEPAAKRHHAAAEDSSDDDEGLEEEFADPNQPLRNEVSVALVCQSNVNRSMEAHNLMHIKGFRASSFGAGSKVRLPGPTVVSPNVYDFGTSYEAICNDLEQKDKKRYKKNGLLKMLVRDMAVKTAPERWQDSEAYFNVVVVFEKRVYDTVCADLESRSLRRGVQYRPTHVVNIDTRDDLKHAKDGAEQALDLVRRFYAAVDDWEDQITSILDSYEKQHSKEILHNIFFL